MSVNVIDTIKPKNNGTFPVVEAVDVKVTNSQRLDAALNAKANQTDLAALATTVNGKASQADLTALQTVVNSKASQADFNALSNTVQGKQNALTTEQLAATNSGITSELVSQIDTNTAAIADKADASDVATETASLQAQIDAIITPVTQDAEVENARVDANGITHETLKARIDSDYADVEGDISTLESAMANLNDELYDKKEFSFNNDNGLANISNATYGLYFTEETFVKQIKLRDPSVETVKYRYIATADGEPFADNKLLVCSEEYSAPANEPITINQYLGRSKGIMFDAGTYKYVYSEYSDLSKYKILQTTSYGASNVRIQRAMNYCFAGEITIVEPEERITEHISYETKNLNNTLNLWHSVSTATYALYCTSPTYIKKITPMFQESSGTFSYRYIYDNTGSGFASNSTVSLGEIYTLSVGSSITVEKTIDNKTGLLIYSNSILDYCHSDNVPLMAAKIMSVENGMRTDASTTRISALIDEHFAGAFKVEEKVDSYVKKSELTQFSNNYLYQKKIMAVGDSMVQGHNLSSDKVWLSKIAVRNNMTADNRGKNGAFMSNRQYGGQDNSVYQKLCVPASEFYISTEDLSSCNYILIYAGTNDCEVSITIGELDSINPSEFCGALNLICQALQSRAPRAHIGFITPYLREGKESRCQNYVDAIKNVCAKYSIPVFDNAKDGSICWSSTAIKTALTLNDTYHLNEAGMDFVSLKYEQFLRSI